MALLTLDPLSMAVGQKVISVLEHILGRTGPLKLTCELAEDSGREISYLDITSLYPYSNFVTGNAVL